MKILYTNFHARNGGGHVSYILNLARLLSRDHQITVATPATSRLYTQAAQVAQVQRYDLSFTARLGPMLKEIYELRRLIFREGFDVVHVNGGADHRHVMLACMCLPKAPRIVWTKHNTKAVDSLGQRIRARFGTDGALGVCDFVTDILRSSGYARKPLKTIRLGVDLQRFQVPTDAQRQAARDRFFPGLAADVLVLGSVGGTDLDKGWPLVMRAVAGLPAAQRQRFRILMAGDMPRQSVLNEIQRLGMQDQLVFSGLIPDPETVLAASDIAFVYSFHEAGSYAVCESMAMGLPTLVSDAGGLPELVRNGQDGWVLPKGQEPAVQACLQSILAKGLDPDMKREARARAEDLFSMDKQAQQTLSFYQALCAR